MGLGARRGRPSPETPSIVERRALRAGGTGGLLPLPGGGETADGGGGGGGGMAGAAVEVGGTTCGYDKSRCQRKACQGNYVTYSGQGTSKA